MINANELYSQIGNRIRKLRIEKKLSQTRLAEIIGLTRTSITNIEKGRQKLLIHTLWDLAEALGTDPREILPLDKTDILNKNAQNMLPIEVLGKEKAVSGKEREWVQAIYKKEGGVRASKKKAN